MAEYISRETVNELIENMQNNRFILVCERFNLALLKSKVAEIPAADVQPVKQWVKLHDKRPDTEGFYIVCDQYGECEVAEYIPNIKSWFTHKINGEIRYWMPLPEPQKDGDTK